MTHKKTILEQIQEQGDIEVFGKTQQQRTRGMRRQHIIREEWDELFEPEMLLLRWEYPLYFNKYNHRMNDSTYWRILRTIWSHSENLHENPRLWKRFWNSKRDGKQGAMTGHENWLLKQLIENENPLVIYRGYQQVVPFYQTDNARMSWTLNKDLAKWFATRFFNATGIIMTTGSLGVPRVLTGYCSGKDIHAYINSREEDEIIIDSDKVEIISNEIQKLPKEKINNEM